MSNLRVVQFRANDRTDEAIEMLEDLIERLRDRRGVDGIGVALSFTDRSISSEYRASNTWALLGSLRYLEHRLTVGD